MSLTRRSLLFGAALAGGSAPAAPYLWRGEAAKLQELRIPELIDTRKQGQSIALQAQAGRTSFFTPDATKTHVPLPHHHLVDMVRYALGYHGHEIMEEHHAIMPDGQRYFGLMTLKSPYGDYSDTIGLRNAHDKSWPIGVAFGSRVFVCDNTAFAADTVIKRRHTANAKRDLPGIVAGIIEPLRQKREQQHECFQRYQAAPLTDELADQTI